MLHLISLADGADVVIAGGADRPSWSPQGTRLAYSAQDGIHLLNPTTGEDRRLPGGDPLIGPVRWSGDGAFLALPVRSPSGHEHVDLADPYLLARFPVPTLGADVSDPVLNGDGTELAVSRSGDAQVTGTWLVRLRTADASPRRLGTDIRPLAYADAGTLLAVERPADSPAGLIRVTLSTGDRVRVAGSLDSADLPTVAPASSGRLLGFLHTDNLGVVQAFVANADGSNPTQLTRFSTADGRIAFAIALAA
jgi:Tol biopolymer transport system component